MRRSVALTALPVALTALLFMAPLAACQAPAPEVGPLSEEDVAAIKASADVFTEAALAGDWAAFASLYTEDVILMPPNGPVVEGRMAVQAWMEPFPSFTQYQITIVQIDGRGDLAFLRGTYSQTFKVEKQPDGTWLIAVEIWNFSD